MLWTLDPTGVCLEPALRVDLVLLFCFLQGRFVLCVYVVCALLVALPQIASVNISVVSIVHS